MSDTGAADNQQIKYFVREVLACACPDEVFEHIRLVDDAAGLASADSVYEVGGRLIVAIFVPTDWRELAQRLGQLVAAGRQYRDQCGCNRFRLVVASDEDQAGEHLLTVFRSLPDIDEKVHLHVVSPESLPFDVLA